jgi:O-antigen/teichoic acid export membrane protein
MKAHHHATPSTMNPQSEPQQEQFTHLSVGSLQNALGLAVCLATGLVTAGILSRHLGPAAYGLLGLTVSIVFMVEMTITAGFKRSTEKLIAETPNWKPIAAKALQTQLILSMAALLFLFFLAPVLASLLKTPELTFTLRIYAISLPIGSTFGVFQSILTGQGRYRQRAVLTALYWLVRLGLILLTLLTQLTITAVLMANMVASATVMLLSRRMTGAAFFKWSRFPASTIMRFAWPLSLVMVATTFLGHIDLLFVKRYNLLPEAIGYYSASQNLAIVPGMLAGSLSPLLLAKLSTLIAERNLMAAKVLVRNSQRIIFCSLPFAALVAGSATEVLTLIYGASYQAAAPLLVFLLFGALGNCLRTVGTFTLVAANKPRLPLMVVAPFIPIAYLGYYFLVPGKGAIPAAMVSCCISWAMAMAVLYGVYRTWDLKPIILTGFRTALISVIVYIAASYWTPSGIGLLLKLTILSPTVVVMLIVSGEITTDERTILVRILTGRRRNTPVSKPLDKNLETT